MKRLLLNLFAKRSPPMSDTKPVNLGVTTVIITFEDNTSIGHKIYGHDNIPSKIAAKQFMATVPKRDFRYYNEAGTKLTYKDIRSLELGATEDYYV